jgi:UDPglucose 6-dehydrogenase
MGVDYEQVHRMAEADPMTAPEHLSVFHSGYRGYGGKCLPKDTASLLHQAKRVGVELSILEAANVYNEELIDAHGERYMYDDRPGRGEADAEQA